jgi:hypothetical protein
VPLLLLPPPPQVCQQRLKLLLVKLLSMPHFLVYHLLRQRNKGMLPQ